MHEHGLSLAPSVAPIAPPPLIQLDRVSKRYVGREGSFDAVRDVSLSIRAADTFGIIGKSGAGKSTLLRLINLLERPDTGRVQVAGTELTTLRKRELRRARQSIGMIFQQFNLLQNLTVFDNVAFPLRVHGVRDRQRIDARVARCLEIVGLIDKRGSHPAQLSGGQKQRVAIARALVSEPAVLLCDEPTSALDPETTRSVLGVLRDINQRLGVTIVIVTHELAVVRALCRHVAVMEAGRVVEQAEISRAGVTLHTALGRELVREAAHPYEEVA
ncbi:D-methionine ABC transporter ATP-binding protein [Bordetella ansorpii]|jgi:D-methionine transport system ATP-binding protein|uniref:Cell division ATP-binding protein FtsE n=1 Tax=Bordetella ansorpii TaxID=288768 RepID=A0A157Q5Q8_9BORD|nr:methionine ABC transporter ATP-binding protein [Bordetella ansorpii]SAI40896.1 D-methionine ABC transporter ATP-binding protein [Bordetella ansorpii]